MSTLYHLQSLLFHTVKSICMIMPDCQQTKKYKITFIWCHMADINNWNRFIRFQWLITDKQIESKHGAKEWKRENEMNECIIKGDSYQVTLRYEALYFFLVKRLATIKIWTALYVIVKYSFYYLWPHFVKII